MTLIERQSIVGDMASLASRIKQVRKLHGLSQEKFADAIGEVEGVRVTRGAVGNWELGGGISRANLTAIANKFDVPLDWLERAIGEAPVKDRSATLLTKKSKVTSVIPNTDSNAQVVGAVSFNRKIPVYGHAMGGKHGEFVLNGNKVADILAPASLDGVPDAYAVYISGSSMEDRYFAGEVAFIHPGMPVRKGDFVVAQIAQHEGEAPLAFVKRFVSFDDRRLKLEQLNPKKYLEFPKDRVVSVHLIWMSGRA